MLDSLDRDNSGRKQQPTLLQGSMKVSEEERRPWLRAQWRRGVHVHCHFCSPTALGVRHD